jgi:branched-chain amino acid transport system permease protein
MTVFAASLGGLLSFEFWVGAGVLAGIYGIFALGLQLNVGFTGILNFGQAGFMAVGAYAMGILVVDAQWSFWLALPASMAVAVLTALLIGLPSLRLRADYFAIVTIAFSEIVRYVAQNARGFTGGNQGLLAFDGTWIDVSSRMLDSLRSVGLGDQFQLPLLLVCWTLFAACALALTYAQRSPWGRVLRAIREDEDAARALGKNTFAYKLQSIVIAAGLGAIAGWLLALNLAYLNPTSFEPLFTFLGYALLIVGGLANYLGVAVGAVILWVLLEGSRFIDLPLAEEKVAALRFVVVGLALIVLMAVRPQGLLGKREEMVLGG